MYVRSYGSSVAGSEYLKEDEIPSNDTKLLYAVADGVTFASFGSGESAGGLFSARYLENSIRQKLTGIERITITATARHVSNSSQRNVNS